MKTISGCGGWKHVVKNGLVAWLEHSNMEEAKEIVSKLGSCNAVKVTVMRRSDTKVPVVTCEDIDFQKLIRSANLVNNNDE